MNKNRKWEDETDRLRNSFFTEGFHCLVYNVSEAYNLVKAHKHDFPQFVIMQSGATRQTQSSRAYHLGSGDILFTPPGVMHSMSLAEQKYFYNFSVTTEIARAALTAACGEECGFADITPLITPREKDMALILNQITSLEATLDGIMKRFALRRLRSGSACPRPQCRAGSLPRGALSCRIILTGGA